MAIRATTVAQDKDLASLLEDEATISIDIDATCILDWINENFEPDQVFDIHKLAAWAVENGYEKIE